MRAEYIAADGRVSRESGEGFMTMRLFRTIWRAEARENFIFA